jgi:hypothetical protein
MRACVLHGRGLCRTAWARLLLGREQAVVKNLAS